MYKIKLLLLLIICSIGASAQVNWNAYGESYKIVGSDTLWLTKSNTIPAKNRANYSKYQVDRLFQSSAADGVITAGTISFNSTTSVATFTSQFTYRIAGNNYTPTQTTEALAARDATYARIDLITGTTSATYSHVTGIAEYSPIAPTPPANTVVIAQVYRYSDGTDLVIINNNSGYLPITGGSLFGGLTIKNGNNLLFDAANGSQDKGDIIWRSNLTGTPIEKARLFSGNDADSSLNVRFGTYPTPYYELLHTGNISKSAILSQSTIKQPANFKIGGSGTVGYDLRIGNNVDSIVADSNSYQHFLPTLLVSRNINLDTINYDNIRDLSVINPNIAGSAFASFDVSVEAKGSLAYNHLASFQDRMIYSGTSTLTNHYGYLSIPVFNSGTTTNRYGAIFSNPTGSGTLLNNYAVYVRPQSMGSTTNYAIYTEGSTTPSYFGGKVGFGQFTATARAHFAAGSTSAGSAPIKFQQGNLMTTPEQGAIEFLGSRLYFTNQSSARDALAYSGDFTNGTTNYVGANAIFKSIIPTGDPLPTLGTYSGIISARNSGSTYGMHIGVLGSGDMWMQQQRFDGTATAYNMLLQPSGGKVGVRVSAATGLVHIGAGSATANTQPLKIDMSAVSLPTGVLGELSFNNNVLAFVKTGTARDPFVFSSDLASYVPSSRTLTAGYGINTLGDLSANRTVSVDTSSVDGVVSKSRSNTALALKANTTGAAGYIQNGTTPQTADYNIAGAGTIGTNLSVGVSATIAKDLTLTNGKLTVNNITGGTSPVQVSADFIGSNGASGFVNSAMVRSFNKKTIDGDPNRWAGFAMGGNGIVGYTALVTAETTNPTTMSGNMVFVTKGSTYAERMRLDSLGKLGIGVLSPTAIVHVKAGTTAANTAPFKYNSGSLMTTAESGAKEFLTDKEYLTITTGAARKEITLNDVALNSGIVPVTTTNGRLTNTTVTSTELGYLSGVTSAIQTQLNTKGAGTVTSITPGYGFTSATPITTSGTLVIDTASSIQSKARANASFALKANLTTNTFSGLQQFGLGAQFNSGTAAVFNNAANTFHTNILPTTITANRSITLPDASGTMALTSDISSLNVTSGTYTPTATLVANATAITLLKGHYVRVGNEVTVTINYLGLDATTGGITFDVSLPIASNLGASDDLSGGATVTGNGLGAVNMSCSANTTNDRATIGGSQPGLTSATGTIRFTYTVI